MSKFESSFHRMEKIHDAPCSMQIAFPVLLALANFFGIILIFTETQNEDVRFLSVQSIFLWGTYCVANVLLTVLSGLPLVGGVFWGLSALANLAFLGLLIFLSYNAYNRLKIVWKHVEKYSLEWSKVHGDD